MNYYFGGLLSSPPSGSFCLSGARAPQPSHPQPPPGEAEVGGVNHFDYITKETRYRLRCCDSKCAGAAFVLGVAAASVDGGAALSPPLTELGRAPGSDLRAGVRSCALALLTISLQECEESWVFFSVLASHKTPPEEKKPESSVCRGHKRVFLFTYSSFSHSPPPLLSGVASLG